MSNQATVDYERFSALRNKIMDRSDLDKIDLSKVLESIQKWSGSQYHQLDLFDIIANLFHKYENKFEKGRESEQIDEIVRINIIEDWRNNKASDHLIEIERKILDSTNSKVLLKTYRKLLEGETIASGSNSKTFLHYGLISRSNNQLTIANEIYRTVFNIQWIEQHWNNLTFPSENTKRIKDSVVPQYTSKEASRTSTILSLVSFLFVFFFLLPLSIFTSQKTPEDKSVPSPSPFIDEGCKKNLKEIELSIDRILTQESNLDEENPIPKYFGRQIYWENENDLNEACQLEIEKSLHSNALKAAGEHKKGEKAIEFLCLIRDREEKSSEYFDAAQKKLAQWYNPTDPSDLSFKVDDYISRLQGDLPNACPAAPPELLKKLI